MASRIRRMSTLGISAQAITLESGNVAPEIEREVTTFPAQPLSARYFDRYRVEAELGRGGMGVVILARDEELDKQVALKLLPVEVACDIEAIASLKKEVLRGMALLHPGIVRVFNFERDARGVAIVMEYVAGETLTDRRRRESGECFDCDDVLPWIDELCGILDYAHTEAQIAHRDLKPRNIIITPENRVKVADFGLAAGLCGTLSRTSMHGDASGTPPYMSPQQVRGETPTHFDDIYALGATIYELLTGKPPFYRGDIFAQVLEAIPPTLEQRRADRGVTGKAPVPPAWEQAIAACLAKEPGARPPSAKAFRDWLRDANAVPHLEADIRIIIPPRATPEAISPARRNPTVRAEPPKTHTAPADSTPPSLAEPRRLRSAGAPFAPAALLQKAAAVLCAAALSAGGTHALRHRSDQASQQATQPDAIAPAPIRPNPASPLRNSTLQPAPAISPARLDEPHPAKPH